MTKRLDLAKARLKAAVLEHRIATRTANQVLRRLTKADRVLARAEERLNDLLARTAGKNQ